MARAAAGRPVAPTHLLPLPVPQGCSDKVEGHPTRTKYGFVWTAHYSCPGMCSGGVCKWTQACRMRVYTRRNGSYYAAPMLRCVEQ